MYLVLFVLAIASLELLHGSCLLGPWAFRHCAKVRVSDSRG